MNGSAVLAKEFPFGLLPAVHTPLDSQGELRLDAVDRQVEHILSSKVAGAFVAGTTGECHSLTVDQRRRLVQRWCDAARGTGLSVIVHVGHNCQRDACELAEHAAASGATAIAAMAPFYFKPDSTESLIDFLAPIAAHAAKLPFYYYDIPHFTGVRLNMSQFLLEGRKRMPNLAGLKFTNSDLMEMQHCVQLEGGAFNILHGFDETLLAGVSLGARGAVGNTYNVAPGLYQRLLNSWASGDWSDARLCQAKSAQLIATFQRFEFQAAAKAAMELVGIDCGPPLPPLAPLTAESKRRLFHELEKLEVINRS